MIVIDPLKLKIYELLKNGSNLPLEEALMGFVSLNDIKIIRNLILSIKYYSPDPRNYVYIDITPYKRFGNIKSFIANINEIEAPRPVIMVKSKEFLEDFRLLYGEQFPVSIINFTDKGEFLEFLPSSSEVDVNTLVHIQDDFQIRSEKGLNLSEFRQIVSNERLQKILFENDCIEIPYKGLPHNRVLNVAGRYYIEMRNGMLVSCYLNLKKLGKYTKLLIDIAYEIVLDILDYFCDSEDPLLKFDRLITPNNTSLFLASTVQAIIHKPIIPIDKLGPIPSLQLHSEKMRSLLKGKTVYILEEVVSTGSEIDRSLMFLNSIGAKTKRIIGIFDLEIGSSLLSNGVEQVSLCKPKQELNYVYRSG